MKHLANNMLRTKNMVGLLNAMGVPIDNTKVVCHDERVVFHSTTTKENERLAAELQELLQQNTVKPDLKRVTLADLLAEEITQATCIDNLTADTHKKSCLAVLNVLQLTGLDFTIDEQQEYLNIQLPSAAFAPLFNSLNYKCMSIEGEKIKFNVKEFLKNHKQELILIDGKSPLLLAHSNSFEDKKVFYAEKRVSEDTLEVTPYFFVPEALTPPTYHFVLDTSDSMQGQRLTKLKKSVIEFADALFKFQPDAVINITEFNSETKNVGMGSYRKEDFFQLSQNVNGLKAKGYTRLFGTVSDQLSMLMKSNQHNNILLFTDGENTIGDNNALSIALEKSVTSLKNESSIIPARNKFFILSYGVIQASILDEVAKLFGSLVLNTDTIDFAEALEKKEKLQEWAAVRELFTCRMEVTDNTTLDAKSEEYVCSYDMSGQFVALKSKQYKDNETLYLTITDSNGKTLLDDKKVFAKKPVEASLSPGSAKNATQLGVFSMKPGTKSKEESYTPPEFSSNL
ncbi:VWA domain-containing protein [Legionella qingyii]|uniref:VWA domain-containing protein n=1 Tax=Legionella qingyii TaxID=2184757 RepID=A0A317U450_9GAMM|nr:vWA domain-containing protein [Legionella qingyii]PWY56724.1 VWA domain-containing protein [Legionella qingyii]RUR23720.1 VWA domain-containing protein [Legionella qingyii]RUR26303.1 VWA domain-containing protein [Legionella qingyii]